MGELEGWLRQLRSGDTNKREAAKKSIVALSNESTESRIHVILELLKLAHTEHGTSEFARSYERFVEWKEVTDVLGELKATEAIETLIQCLDCNNGMAGLSPDRFPATKAVIMIGPPAIPKLALALDSQAPETRLMAAQALYAIGGPESKKVLQEAVRKHRYKQTAAIIRDMLRNWESSGK